MGLGWGSRTDKGEGERKKRREKKGEKRENKKER